MFVRTLFRGMSQKAVKIVAGPGEREREREREVRTRPKACSRCGEIKMRGRESFFGNARLLFCFERQTLGGEEEEEEEARQQL